MLGALLTLPDNFIATTTGYIATVFTDVSPLVMLVIGLPLAFWLIRRVIGLVRFR